MSTTYRIAEVAQRSGFTPAALRYYEDIGLVAPAGRTDAGYRLYDETSLERLRFIARAKQLGCSLDEIADLVTAWDGGRCAPVQDRLRTTVEVKINDAHAQIAALTILAADLQRAAATLSTQPVDGPCDETCGCTTDTALLTLPTSVPLVAKAAATAEGPEGAAPIACTLDGGDSRCTTRRTASPCSPPCSEPRPPDRRAHPRPQVRPWRPRGPEPPRARLAAPVPIIGLLAATGVATLLGPSPSVSPG
jgi:DNA-binding transcriptional MerR regulator